MEGLLNWTHAVLIGTNEGLGHQPLHGAVQDVIDLAERLSARGIPVHMATSPVIPDEILPGISRSEASIASVESALNQAAAALDPDGLVWVHASGRGLHTERGPELLLADGTLPLGALSKPFSAHPVRSVAFVIDAGFHGGTTPGERSCGPRHEGPATRPDFADPMLLAGGLDGVVHERRIAGRVRGVFTRMLTTLLDDPATESWSLGRIMQVLRQIPGEERLGPVLLPPQDGEIHPAAGVPFRGVHAAFQWIPTHEFSNFPAFGADIALEQFDFGPTPPFPSGQFSVATNTQSGPPQPAGPSVFTFTNHPFSDPAPNPPAVTPADRAYEVTASWSLGGTVYVVIRGGISGNVTAAEWYTNIDNANLLQTQVGTLTFTESAMPSQAQWDQSTWTMVTQSPQ